jgi:hypothetical protein
VQQAALFQEMTAADGIDADTKLLAVDGATTFHEVADGTARVTILGNTVTMPESAAAALRSASTAVPFPAGEFLPGADSRRALPVARQLLRLGALRIATVPGRVVPAAIGALDAETDRAAGVRQPVQAGAS